MKLCLGGRAGRQRVTLDLQGARFRTVARFNVVRLVFPALLTFLDCPGSACFSNV